MRHVTRLTLIIDGVRVESRWNDELKVEDDLTSIMTSDSELSREVRAVTGMLLLKHKGPWWMLWVCRFHVHDRKYFLLARRLLNG